MGEKRGMKALEAWCRRITEGYKDVSIENMSSSWRDGLAFCAIIHHFRPELIDFDSLNKENILQNNELAFSIAEKHLGIPALLEAEDMVKYKVPDKLSIMTYVSQFYQCFQASGQAISPNKATKRPLENSSESSPSVSPDSPPGKITTKEMPSSLPRRHDVCQSCQHRVYILERLIIDSKLYHRTCFKCHRCQSVLKPGSYVEGDEVGQYECVSCPDEEEAEKAAIASMVAARVARQTSPSESWHPVPSKQPTITCKMSSQAEARMAFLKKSFSADECDSITDSRTNLEIKTALDLPENKDENENIESSSEKPKSDDMESQPNATGESLQEPSKAPVTVLATAPLAVPEEELTLPVPSPRLRRKRKSSDDQSSQVPQESEVSDDVFLTPSTSPLPIHRQINSSHLPNVTTDEDKLGASSRNNKSDLTVKPVANVRLSRSRERHSDGTSPSQVGLILRNMPVIQPAISDALLSPTKMAGEVPPKPQRLSLENEREEGGAVMPAPRRRISYRSKSPKTSDAGKTTAAMPTESSEAATQVRTKGEDSEDGNKQKKVPPPRPEPPAFLKAPKASSPKDASSDKKEIFYPEDLNPFSDENEGEETTKYLNPFDSDDDESVEQKRTNDGFETSTPVRESPGTLKNREAPAGSNPFGSDDDEEEEEPAVELRRPAADGDARPLVVDDKPKPLPRRSLEVRSTSVSPAGSLSKTTGKTYKSSHSANTSPAGSVSRASKYSTFGTLSADRRTSRDSGLDVSPTGSLNRSHRKKRPAPPPPVVGLRSSDGSLNASPRPLSRSVKKSPAPPPPKIELQRNSSSPDSEFSEKTMKELDNLTLKSSGSDTGGLSSPSPGQAEDSGIGSTIKTKHTFGYWKKKKPAPPVPLPPKRQIVKLPMEEILKELTNIEEKQLEMEKMGVELEKAIRHGYLEDNDTSSNAEEDDLVLQLFDLVNQKNILSRRQAELVYLRRQQRLEEEHAELEYQIRCLMAKPDAVKTDEDRELEEQLIKRLMDVVSQRNEIIESMENDRLREAIEDQSIQQQMALHQGSSRTLMSSSSSNSLDPPGKTEKKKKKEKQSKKTKEKEKEKSKTVDEDKDFDDSEAAVLKSKKDKKRKWF